MRSKHIHIEQDSSILKEIYQKVGDELNVNRNGATFHLALKFMVYFFLMTFAYLLIYAANNVVFFFASFVLYGLAAVLMGFNFAHDFSHDTIFKSKRLNNLFFTFIYALLGAHAEAWKYRHIQSHHYAPNVKDYDSDLQITSLIRVEPSGELKWFHKYQHIYAPLAYTSYSFYWVFIKDFVIYLSADNNPLKKKFGFHVSFWLQKFFYLAYLLILPILFSQQSVAIVVIAFLVMHLTQSLLLLFTFFITHHVEGTAYFYTDKDGRIATSWLANQIKSSNDFYPFSRSANFVFGGFNNHIAHHLFPHIHHIHYPQLNKILYQVLNARNIKPNETTYLGGVISHLRHLKNMSVATPVA